jgi:hypothetical protein
LDQPGSLFSPYYSNLTAATPNFPTNYWHKVADGVIDLEIRPFDQFGNDNEENYIVNSYGAYSGYPIYPTFSLRFHSQIP